MRKVKCDSCPRKVPEKEIVYVRKGRTPQYVCDKCGRAYQKALKNLKKNLGSGKKKRK